MTTSLESLLEKFVFSLQHEKNASPKTIENYTLWLNRMTSFVGEETDIKDLHLLELLDYRMHLEHLGLSKKTINYHIVALRSFLKFLQKYDIDCINPGKLELAKVPPREVSFLTQEEVDTILAMPGENCKNELQQMRDTTILYFLYSTGMRVSELCTLENKQIESDSNQIRIVGKGRKVRSIFLTEKARTLLEAYTMHREDTSAYVFVSLAPNSFGKKLSRNAIEDIVKKYARLAGIKKKVTPHTLRHSFATSLLKKGADIRSVQALLGHSSIQTTQIYTHVDDKYLQEVHKLLE